LPFIAALAAKGTAAIIGEIEGGWFCLPPWSLWEAGLDRAEKRMALKAIPLLEAETPEDFDGTE
jgi:hypothetical protein